MWGTLKPAILANLITFAIFAVWHLVRAPFLLDIDQEHAVANEKSQIQKEKAEKEQTLGAIKRLEKALDTEGPQLFIRIDYPAVVKRNPGLGGKYRVVIVENNSDKDAFNVQVERLQLDSEGRIRVDFKPVSRIGRHERAEIEATVIGLEGGNTNDFETVYYFGNVGAHWHGEDCIEYTMAVTYGDYQRLTRYRASVRFVVESHLQRTDIEWLGVERL